MFFCEAKLNKLNEAFRLLTNEPNIPLIAVHKAKYFADKDEQLSMGPGGFVKGIIMIIYIHKLLFNMQKALEFATGKEAIIAGKPTKKFFELALEQMYVYIVCVYLY